MRTTVTLDADVERLLRAAMKERGLSFKDALNESIRAGASKRSAKPKPYRQKTFSMGAEQMFRWDKAMAVADALEDEELAGKIAVRK